MGLAALLGTRLELSNFVLNVIPMAGLALSIDFALIIVSRFREELVKGAAELAMVNDDANRREGGLFSAASVFSWLNGPLVYPAADLYDGGAGRYDGNRGIRTAVLTLLPALWRS